MVKRGFVIVSGCYRLHLELDGLIGSRIKSQPQSAFCITVILSVLCSHKMNRPSYYCRPDFDPELMLRFFPQVPENPGDQIFKGVPSPENLRAVESATTQKRLEGLNQSTLRFLGEIVLYAFGARPRLQGIHTTFLHLLKIQQ